MADTRINKDGSKDHRCRQCDRWHDESEYLDRAPGDELYLVCQGCRDGGDDAA